VIFTTGISVVDLLDDLVQGRRLHVHTMVIRLKSARCPWVDCQGEML